MTNTEDKKFHKELNEKLWINNKLRPEVANKLRKIANAFIEFLDIPTSAIKDIVLTGSNVSYNYTPQSDLDLHLIINFEKVHKDCPIVGEYLLSKKSEFNQKHDILIYGIPVEVYAEGTDNKSVCNGLYSLKYNKWLKEPKKLKPVNNDIAVEAKYKEYVEAIENVKDKDIAEILIDKIKNMRKAGLHKEGEFSVENLVFKKLRNNGSIGKLMDIKKEGIDKELSLEEKYEEAILDIEEMLGGLNTATTAMAPYPTPVAGQTGVYTKENKGKSKPAMYKYKYTKSRQSKIIPVVENLIEEINNICEEIFKLKSDALNALPKEEAALQQAKRELNSIPLHDNIARKKAQERVYDILTRVNNVKKEAGFKPNVRESLIEEINNICKNILEGHTQSSAEYFGKKYGNYKKRIEGNPEYNIPKGNAEREQALQNKWNDQAKEIDNNSTYYQQHALETHKELAKAFKEGKISKEEFIQKIKRSGKNIRKFSPGAMNDETKEKYKTSVDRTNKYKKYASK